MANKTFEIRREAIGCAKAYYLAPPNAELLACGCVAEPIWKFCVENFEWLTGVVLNPGERASFRLVREQPPEEGSGGQEGP